MRYRFKLEPVLRVRRRKEDLLKEDLARLKRLCDREKRVLRELLSDRQRSEEDMAGTAFAGPGGDLDLDGVLQYDAYLLWLSDRIERAVGSILELEERVRGKTQEVVEASREKKIVERLKEKGFEAYLREILRVEQNELDEVGSLQFARRERA